MPVAYVAVQVPLPVVLILRPVTTMLLLTVTTDLANRSMLVVYVVVRVP